MADSDKTMFLYVGAYEDEDAASEDYKALVALHKEGWVGSYDAGIVSKDDEGKLDIKRRTDSTAKGTKRGLAVGALMGVIFPPSILASGLIGAGAGRLIGKHFNDIPREDLKMIGDYIERNQSALVIVGESKVEEMVDKATRNALKAYKEEFNADVKAYNKELDAAIKAV